MLPGIIEYTGYYYGPQNYSELYRQNSFSVSNNYPNPFSGKTEIKICCEKPLDLKLSVYKVLGSLVYTEDLGHFQKGTSTLKITDTNLTGGIYLL